VTLTGKAAFRVTEGSSNPTFDHLSVQQLTTHHAQAVRNEDITLSCLASSLNGTGPLNIAIAIVEAS